MKNFYKFNVKNLSSIAILIAVLTFNIQLNASNFSKIEGNTYKSANSDTTNSVKKDTVISKIDTLRISKDSIDAPVHYNAEDSGVLIISTKEFFLYGKATTQYKDIDLQAATIQYNQEKQTISAKGSSDTSKGSLNKTKMKQGETSTLSDSIAYNMKTQKGITYNTYYQEGELFVNANRLKKADSNIVFAYRGSFTTCNLDTPHFVFRTKKMKIINNKIGVSGPAHPEFEGVPIPVYIPFGIYPLSRGRHSGILSPTFNSSEDFGIGLEGLGFYKVISPNADVTFRGNLYSYGGWNININSKYLQRYKYNGGFNISFQRNKTLNRYSTKTENEFTLAKSYMINWSHSRDAKARPGSSFSANVNFGSTKYNENILNNPYQNFNNQLSSTIAYSKTWDNKYSLNLNLSHDQNNKTRLVNLSLPNGSFNASTIYPFQKKDAVGTAKWYEKLGIGYNANFQNRISFYDTAANTRKILDTLQWGAEQSIPITLALPSLGPIVISPSISFSQRLFGQKLIRYWDDIDTLVKTRKETGLFLQNNMSMGISGSTRIFGTYNFKNSSTKIRHEIRPQFGLSYTPDLVSKYFYNVQVDTSKRTVRLSQFEGGIYGSYSEGNFGGVSFGVDNLLEMKVKDKKDTAATATKKVKLIDGFGFNSSYNLMADSFALGNFSLYLRSTLFEKISITANANLDPYDVDKYGVRKNSLLFKQGKLGRLTSGSLSVSTNFQSKSKDGKNNDKSKSKISDDPYMTAEEQQKQAEYVRQNPAEFTDFNIPWRIDLSYSLTFSRILKSDYSGYKTETFSSVNFSGDFSLTPKWKAGANGYYDVKNMNLQQFSMFVSREMHCWQLSINITPIGLYRSFSINISPKSGILRDLKINRNRTFSNY